MNECNFIGKLSYKEVLKKDGDSQSLEFYAIIKSKKGTETELCFEIWDTAAIAFDKIPIGKDVFLSCSAKTDQDFTYFRVNNFRVLA